jgi:PAS domain S-box-containing protein
MSTIVVPDREDSSRAVALLAGRTRILEMIATGASLAEILTSLARLIESQSDGMLCSVLLLDEEGCLRSGAAPSLPESYTRATDGIRIGPKAGSCGTAAYRGDSVFVTDILEDPLWENYRDLAVRHGLRACWSTPFFSPQGDVLGTFAMYYMAPRSPRSAETELTGIAARMATIAVERWKKDVEVRRAADSYRALVENLNDIVFSLDVGGNLTYISPPIERHLGYTTSELIGRSFRQLIYPQDLEVVKESLVNTMAGDLSPCEFRVLDKNGGVHWWRSSSRPQVARDQLGGVTGVIVDITEQKQTQENFRKAEQKYRTIFEEAVVGIFQTTPDGRYVTANPELARMLGYSSPEELANSITDVARQMYVDPELRKEFIARIEKEGSLRNFECEVYRKNGSRMWVSVNARAVRQNGRIVAYEGTNEDISERKLLAQQLVQAQRMEAVGRLAGGIAHDFNNLLGVIVGQVELLLQRHSPSDPWRRRVEQIFQAAQRAVSLTGQLLALSRQQVVHPVVLDLNAIVENFNGMIARLIGEDIRVIDKLNPDLGLVKADAAQVEQILLNLVINARDAMPGGGTLTIETSNVEVDDTTRPHFGADEGHYAVITVSDTGIGMDQETMTRMFEPFFTTKEVGKGTGLGLATVYGIVKQNGGHILVSSQPGEGTTFNIFWPRTEGNLERNERACEASTPVARGGATILLVEDADPLREVTRELLEEAGYRVLEARSGEEALALVEEYKAPITLTITDIVMPGMDGPALVRRLKLIRPETKALFVSGYAGEAVLRHGVQPEASGLLHKPFTKDGLISMVREVLSAAS